MDTSTSHRTTLSTREASSTLVALRLPPELLRTTLQVIDDGEVVVWAVQPTAAGIARHQRGVAVFGAVFAVLSGAIAVGLIRDGEKMWGLSVTLLVGLGAVMATAPWRARKAAAHSVYLVTNRRAIVISAGDLGRLSWPTTERVVSTYEPAALTDLMISRRDDGAGDIVFLRRVHEGYDHDTVTSEGFLGVPDVSSAIKALRALGARPRSAHER